MNDEGKTNAERAAYHARRAEEFGWQAKRDEAFEKRQREDAEMDAAKVKLLTVLDALHDFFQGHSRIRIDTPRDGYLTVRYEP